MYFTRRAGEFLKTFAVAVVFGASLPGCSDLLSGSYDYGTLEVSVMRDSGEPVENADLVLYRGNDVTARGRTGSGGRYTFRLLPFGQFGVFVYPPPGYIPPPGQKPYVDGIDIAEGTDKTVILTFAYRTGSLRVETVDPSGKPIPGVGLSLYSTGIIAQDTTAADGVVIFEGVPIGEYGVRAEPPPEYNLQPGPGSSYFDAIPILPDSVSTVRFTFVRR